MKNRVVIAGAVAQRPGQGGHTWVFLQYLLGFRKLGWEVLLLDRLEPEMCVDGSGNPCGLEESVNLSYLRSVLEHYGLEESFALYYDRGREVVGRTREDVIEHVRDSAFLLNVMGYFDDEVVLATAKRRIFLDIDPGFSHMWQDLALADLFRGHDAFLTVGENIGKPGCTIPTCGIEWIPVRQPVVLDRWTPSYGTSAEPFTSVGAWRGPYGPVEYHGETYGLRVHEFRKFFDVPRRTGRRFEIALDIDSVEVSDLDRLRASGWRLVDPRVIAATPWKYQEYLRSSGAEFLVAKNMYVKTNSGWFSDRSICYLASGKPVLAQDTGIGSLYPVGDGLLVYSTPDEAIAGVEEIAADYARHARAARAVAEECFDSSNVLMGIVDKLGV